MSYKIEPLVVFQCSYCDELSACGFNGQQYDESRDECHHPLLLEEARRMVASWNFCLNMDIKEIEKKSNLSNVFEGIEKARKEIFKATEAMPNYMDATLKTFSEMGIDAKEDGECLGGDFYRIRIKEAAHDA